LLLASVLNQGPFPPPALPGFIGNTSLSVTPLRPVHPSRASGCSIPQALFGASRVACVFLCVHAAATTPAQRLGSSLLNPPVVSTFPERVTGSVCASTFSRLARRSLALRPAHSRCHQFVTCISRRLQPFRYLHSCSGSFRLEHLPGGTFTHWKNAAFSRRTPSTVFRD
jgi:hypothetical protein